MKTPNLWGDIPVVERVRAPVEILREQAALLQGLTDNVLLARVEQGLPGAYSDSIRWKLEIAAPALRGHSFTVAVVRQPMRLYPVDFLDRSTFKLEHEARDEKGFVEYLETLLRSEPVRAAIHALLAQSKGVSSPVMGPSKR